LASSFTNATEGGANVMVPAGENIPFQMVYISPIGITYNANNNFSFSQTGFYLVSFGVSQASSDATVGLFFGNDPLGGTLIAGTNVYINEPNDLSGGTFIIEITDLTQVLSLVNTSTGTLTLNVGFGTAVGAFITITRVSE
jgi:hypothetical protein